MCVCVCVCVVVIVQFMERSHPVRKLNSQVVELGSGLEKVRELLEQRNATVNEAQNVLKVCVGLCLVVFECYRNLLICTNSMFDHVSILLIDIF